LFRVLFSGYLF